MTLRALLAAATAALALAGCGGPVPKPEAPAARPGNADLAFLNRVTFGVNAADARRLAAQGRAAWLEAQLRAPAVAPLPAEVQARVDAMTISRRPIEDLFADLDRQRRAADAIAAPEEKKAAQQAYQQELTRLAREAGSRTLLRAAYSPDQLREQMVWFWTNHFNVHLGKANLRALVGDYEERAIRPHALGRFRDLLEATAKHPAMLRYLDNERNARGRLNENFARELMELHTLGVDGGYTQADVQELARILTGFGVRIDAFPEPTGLLRADFRREGLFEFRPGRHDYGQKVLLGKPLLVRGPAELDEALDRLARHPSTSRHIARRLALHFVSDHPPAALVERVAARFRATDGHIAATLRELFDSPEFTASMGTKFKDPLRYMVSAVRLAYDERPILNAGPMLAWLNRLGQLPFGRQTPDGYPLTATEWASPGQLAARLDVAKALGYGSAGLFRGEAPGATDRPAFPQFANALYYEGLRATLGDSTRQALEKAGSPQEWNLLFLSSPEFMHR